MGEQREELWRGRPAGAIAPSPSCKALPARILDTAGYGDMELCEVDEPVQSGSSPDIATIASVRRRWGRGRQQPVAHPF